MTEKCFACDLPLGENPKLADTRDDQLVYVGTNCYALIKAAGEEGYQPPKGGPKLYVVKDEGDTLNPIRDVMARLKAMCLPKTTKEWEQLAASYAEELDAMESKLEELKASYDHCMIDGRPDFSGFAQALHAEANWEQQIKRGDKTGQLRTDVRQLLELAEHVERIGKVQGYIA
jgi:hypothetical protein